MAISVIIPAGGSGSRFQLDVPSHRKEEAYQKCISNKLLMPVGGHPLLLKTITAFSSLEQVGEVVVAAPIDLRKVIELWKKKYRLSNVKWAKGGKTRAESVEKGLRALRRNASWILVHDGARPLIQKAVIEGMIEKVKRGNVKAVIAARKVIPTIKEVHGDGLHILKTVNRETLYEAETPQIVSRGLLMKAYREIPQASLATDEASLMETLGIPVQLYVHRNWNPKVTNWEDWKLVNSYMNQHEDNELRMGFGKDLHRLVPRRKLILGGIKIPFSKGSLGHSDGDALLHAIMDGILGALAWGDIGDWFSDTNPRYKNISSAELLKTILKKVKNEGWRVGQVDATVILQQPKLGRLKEKIRYNISKLMELDSSWVSVKAKTAEGLGPEGAGEAVACEALVRLRRNS